MILNTYRWIVDASANSEHLIVSDTETIANRDEIEMHHCPKVLKTDLKSVRQVQKDDKSIVDHFFLLFFTGHHSLASITDHL